MLDVNDEGVNTLTPEICYASYMLRLQRVRSEDHPTWIVSMQSTKTGELRRFPNLEGLITFLKEEFDSGVGPMPEPDEKNR